MHLPFTEKTTFILKLKDVEIGILKCEAGTWIFKYSDQLKNNIETYNLIVGFPDVNETYKSDSLWPFFRIRIPGLKQPKIQNIIEHENIDIKNEVLLLKRFGKKTIANPYLLYPS